MKSIVSILVLATLAVYAAANPAPAKPIPGTIPRPPPIPPLRVRRSASFPQQPSWPRPQPVPLPRPVPRPQPIPPIRVRRAANIPQQPSWPRPQPVPLPRPVPRPQPIPPIRVRRASSFPKPSVPRPRPVPMPRPVPRPKPIPPIRVRRDAGVPQPTLLNKPEIQRPQVALPQLPQKAPLDVKVIQPSHKHHLIRPNPPLRMERDLGGPNHGRENKDLVPQPTPFINRPISPFSNKRFRRFVDGANMMPNLPSPNNNPSGWEINPNINRDQRGNTHGSVDITHHGENGDFHATWGQNVAGPDKHSETWSVGGKINLPQN